MYRYFYCHFSKIWTTCGPLLNVNKTEENILCEREFISTTSFLSNMFYEFI